MEQSTKPYSVEDVANLLDVSVDMVWRLCRKHELPAVKIGRKWFIKRPELDAKLGISEPVTPSGGSRNKRPRLAGQPIW